MDGFCHTIEPNFTGTNQQPMSTFNPPSEAPSTEHEFNEALISLIRAAHANGVDVEGGWDDRRSRDDTPEWGVEIYEVVKPATPNQ